MSELQPIFGTDQEGLNKYYSPEYDEPLLEYVRILAEKLRPMTEESYYHGFGYFYLIGVFADRYFLNKIDKDKRENYDDSFDIQETIKALGYDVDKFWYLLLFVNDYSFGYCWKGFKLNKSPKAKIEEFVQRILNNVETLDFESSEMGTFKKPMKISLEIKGKHKFVIDESDSIFSLLYMLASELEKIEDGSQIATSHTSGFIKDGKFQYDFLSNSIQIWYFAQMFLSFFELRPPQKTKSKKGSLVSLNKLLLISRLIFIIGLTRKESFLESEDSLKGYLKQYKNYNMKNMANGLYS